MKIRKLKKRVVCLLAPQIVRGRAMRSPIQMQRAFGFVYPLRRKRTVQMVARFGKTVVTRVTPGLVENDLGDPTPIDPISKNHLLFTEPLRITSKEQFIEFYGSPDRPHTPLPVDVLQDLVWGPAGELYCTRVKGETLEEPYVAPLMAALRTSPGERVASPEYGSDIGKWLADGSAEIVHGSHGTYSIIDATRKEK